MASTRAEWRDIVLRQSAHRRSGTMAQLTYDEIRLLRDLKNSNRKISGDKPHGGLNQLAKEGYVRSQQLNISEHFIQSQRRASLRCMTPRGTTNPPRPSRNPAPTGGGVSIPFS